MDAREIGERILRERGLSPDAAADSLRAKENLDARLRGLVNFAVEPLLLGERAGRQFFARLSRGCFDREFFVHIRSVR